MKRLGLLCAMSMAFFSACSQTSDSLVDDDEYGPFKPSDKSSSSVAPDTSASSSSNADSLDTLKMDSAYALVQIHDQIFTRVNTTVSVSAFKILATEVTQKMYAEFRTLPEQKVYNDNLPVTNVNWYEAALFCNEVSKKYGLDTAYVYSSVGEKNVLLDLVENHFANAVRLPTEAEWEAAARGGSSTKYYWGVKDAAEYANYKASTSPQLIAVGSLLPNAFGLYDMSGNAGEWVNDWYSAYPSEKSLVDPVGPKKENAKAKAYRGGSFASAVTELASDDRQYADPSVSSFNRGFRFVIK